jgi:hypothetical protein
MNQHRTVEKAMSSLEDQLSASLTTKDWSVIATTMMGVFAAGYEAKLKEIPKTKARAVKQLNKKGEVVNIFESATEAARFVGGDRAHISKCASGRYGYNTHKGYYWVYL